MADRSCSIGPGQSVERLHALVSVLIVNHVILIVDHVIIILCEVLQFFKLFVSGTNTHVKM